jgi:hypothetical protein
VRSLICWLLTSWLVLLFAHCWRVLEAIHVLAVRCWSCSSVIWRAGRTISEGVQAAAAATTTHFVTLPVKTFPGPRRTRPANLWRNNYKVRVDFSDDSLIITARNANRESFGGQGKAAPLRAIKAYRGRRGTAPPTLNLGTRTSVLNFTPRRLTSGLAETSKFWRTEKSPAPAGIRTPDRSPT